MWYKCIGVVYIENNEIKAWFVVTLVSHICLEMYKTIPNGLNKSQQLFVGKKQLEGTPH